jgi:hypothetical protein
VPESQLESTQQQPATTVPPGRISGLSWLLELAVLAALLLNTAGYVLLSDTHLENASDIADCAGARDRIRGGGLREFLSERPFYPPLHWLYMAASPFDLKPARPLVVVLWGDLILLTGFWCLSAALRRAGASPVAGALCLLLLGGTPVVNAFLKTVHYETTHAGLVALALAAPVASGGLPGRRGCVLLGVVMGAGLLTKWTFALYLLGPVLVSLGLAWRRSTGLRETALRLGLLTVTTAALAALWYVPYLDLPRLTAAAASNDPNFPGVPFWEGYRLRLVQYLWFHVDAAGGALLALLALGVALGCVRTRAPALLCLSCALFPALIFPVFQHQEARYLMPLLPGVCAAAALGFASLPRTALVCALAASAAVSGYQAYDRTWSGLQSACEPAFPGTPSIFDNSYGLVWQPTDSARLVARRCRWLADGFPAEKRPLKLAVHPMEGRLDLKPTVFFHVQLTDKEVLGARVSLAFYAPEGYSRFARDLAEGAIDFVVLSKATLQLDREAVRTVVKAAWTLVPESGEWREPLPPAPLADPFMVRRLRQFCGVADRLETPCGPVFLLVTRELWSRRSGAWPLIEVPEPGPPPEATAAR